MLPAARAPRAAPCAHRPPPRRAAGRRRGGAPPAPQPVPVATFREAASVIANPETGVLNIRATSRQHEKVQEFLDQVLTNAKRQVLIEATVAEVQLNNEYQRGIDWQRLRTRHRSACRASAPATAASSSARLRRHAGNINTNAFVFGGAITSLNFNFALRLLESFGDVRVLSSPKISVLNNQTAVLKVVDNLVYFTIQAPAPSPAGPDQRRSRHLHHHAELGAGRLHHEPGAADQRRDSVVLNLSPTISRKIGDVRRPQPRAEGCRTTQPDPGDPDARDGIDAARAKRPDRRARRPDAGLAQHRGPHPRRAQIPGPRRSFLDSAGPQNQKTELVIFLRPIVIRDPSIDGDYAAIAICCPGRTSSPSPTRAGRDPTACGPVN